MAHSCADGRETRRLYAALSVNARGNGQAVEGRALGGVRGDFRWLPLWTCLSVSQEHLAPRSGLAPALEDAPIDQRPPVEVVIHVARQDEAIDERRVNEQLLQTLQLAEPDQ